MTLIPSACYTWKRKTSPIEDESTRRETVICIGRDSAHMRSHSFRLLIIAALLLSIMIVSNAIGCDPSTEALEIVDSSRPTALATSWRVSGISAVWPTAKNSFCFSTINWTIALMVSPRCFMLLMNSSAPCKRSSINSRSASFKLGRFKSCFYSIKCTW